MAKRANPVKRKRVKSVAAFTKAIKTVLESEGMYSPLYDMAILDLAQVSHLKANAFNDAIGYDYTIEDLENTEPSSMVVEQSREGFRRYKINPAYTIFLDLARESQKMLSELCMTAKSSNAIQDDEFTELKNKMEQAANGK